VKQKHLPDIPVEKKNTNTIRLAEKYHDDFLAIMNAAQKKYSKFMLLVGDYVAHRWLSKTKPQYADEVAHIAQKTDLPGRIALNHSFEFACTTGTRVEKDKTPTLLRALDWSFEGMADKVKIVKKPGKAGHYWDFTYPGMVGVLHGMAPNRFSIAINRAPVPISINLGKLQPISEGFDKIREKYISSNSEGLPPPFLLRKVFEECSNYEEAVNMLSNTKTNAPAIFTITGTTKDESCVIERSRDTAVITKGITCSANHWQTSQLGKAHARANNSVGRLHTMKKNIKASKKPFDWFSGPIVTPDTRLIFEANAKNNKVSIAATNGGAFISKIKHINLK
jgi:hypothetical protein